MPSTLLNIGAFYSNLELSPLEWFGVAIFLSFALIVALAAVQELTFLYYKTSLKLEGPSYVLPFLGGLVPMVKNPYKYWHKIFESGHVAVNALLGRLVFVANDPAIARGIFERTDSDLPMIMHPNAHFLMGNYNIAFMTGDFHRQARQRLLPLFTQVALNSYLKIQEQCIRKHLKLWIQMSKEQGQIEMRPLIFNLNTETSMTVFIGAYLTPEVFVRFQAAYKNLTEGFLCWPLPFPGTKLWSSRQSKKFIVSELEKMIKQAKTNYINNPNHEPKCLLDYWMKNTVEEIQTAEKQGLPFPPHSTDFQIANLMLDFLFASQDASTSSLTYSLHLLGEHRDVFDKVRQEQDQVRPNHEPINGDTIAHARYTWQVMKEVLRYRPPATIVPYMAAKDYVVNPSLTLPKGSLVIPSVWSSNRAGFSDPESFNPDRFSIENGEDKKYEKNFMTFGAGPHYCMGQRYAMNHIMSFISIICQEMDYTRKITPNMNEIIYLPTIYPADGVILENFAPRQSKKEIAAC